MFMEALFMKKKEETTQRSINGPTYKQNVLQSYSGDHSVIKKNEVLFDAVIRVGLGNGPVKQLAKIPHRRGCYLCKVTETDK